MTLSRPLRETLRNSLIPLRVMAFGSMAIAAIAAAGAITLLEKPAEKAANIAMRTVQIGLLASGGCLSVAGLLYWDTQKRHKSQWARYSEFESERFRVQATSQSLYIPQPPESYLDGLTEDFENRYGSSQPKNATLCQTCENYHGEIYGGNSLVCAIHPYGLIGADCPDWEPKPTEYRLVRLQGVGWSNLYFVQIFTGQLLSETFQEAIEVSPSQKRRLIKRFRLKHSTGLPGCVFKSKASTITGAYEELINSCPE